MFRALMQPSAFSRAELQDFVLLDDTCAICTEGFRKGQALTRLSCGHIYHRGCLATWFGVRAVCPTCCKAYPGIPDAAFARDHAVSLFTSFI